MFAARAAPSGPGWQSHHVNTEKRVMKRIKGIHPVRAALVVMGVLALASAYVTTGQPATPAPDPARLAAWEKIAPRLAQGETDGDDLRDEHIKLADSFFAAASFHSPDFADDVL